MSYPRLPDPIADLREQAKKIIRDRVSALEGCKAEDLLKDPAVARIENDWSLSPQELLDEILAAGDLVEVEYVLPRDEWKARSVLFPAGTQVFEPAFPPPDADPVPDRVKRGLALFVQKQILKPEFVHRLLPAEKVALWEGLHDHFRKKQSLSSKDLFRVMEERGVPVPKDHEKTAKQLSWESFEDVESFGGLLRGENETK